MATKSPTEFFMELVQLTLKFIWKSKCAKVAKIIHSEKGNEKGFDLLDYKI